MFFDRERARIDRDAKNLPIGHELCPQLTHWERQKLCNVIADRNGGIPEEKELIETGHDDRPYDAYIKELRPDRASSQGSSHTHHPCTEGAAWNTGVVRVCDSGSHLGIWRVILCQGDERLLG